MRKDWLYWIGGGSSKSAKRGRFTREDNDTSPPPPSGCMCLQIFDLNQFHFPLVHQHQPSLKQDDDSGVFQDIDHENTNPKGVEAPRNSLELEETLSSNGGAASSVSSTMKEHSNLSISVGIQIRTSCDSKSPRESTSECSSSSPGTKTPGVVARLMGLDLLPEGGSPSSARLSNAPSLKSRLQHHYSAGNRNDEDRARNLLKNKSKNGTRSLPETPRVSSSSDRRSDVDQSRLSLQITNKDCNNNTGEDDQFDLASYIAKRVVARRREELARSSIQEDESRSQRSHYAKQIVKQMKESVSRRKFGVDITSSVNNRDEQKVVLLKPNSKKSLRENDQSSRSTSKQTTPSCSPRLRLLENKNHDKPRPESQTTPPKISFAKNSPEENATQVQYTMPEVQLIQHPQSPLQPKAIQICEKAASERYNLHLKKTPPTCGAAIIRNKKEEPFIRSPTKNKDKNSRKFPLSNELLSSNVPTIFLVKKDPPVSPSKSLFFKQGREISRSQTSRKSKEQLPSSSSQSYTSTCSATIQQKGQGRCKNDVEIVGYYYFEYIQRILKRTGINSSTPISLAKWFSPSHPLDPAIFHYVELFHHPNSCKQNQRSDRKLIFHLADELLAQILKPYINVKPWACKFSRMGPDMNGSELMEEICSRIEACPSANCQVLEDIDALIGKDFDESSLSEIEVAFEEEAEGIVGDIERDIVDSLVHETAVEVVFGSMSRRMGLPDRGDSV